MFMSKQKSYLDYKIFPEKRLIIEYYGGHIVLEEIIVLKDREVVDPHYDSSFDIIDDFRDATFNIDPADVKEYVNYVVKGKNYGKRNTVFLTDNPEQVVISTLFDNYKNSLPINVKIVSTIKIAIEFVSLKPEDFDFVDNSLREMRNRSLNEL